MHYILFFIFNNSQSLRRHFSVVLSECRLVVMNAMPYVQSFARRDAPSSTLTSSVVNAAPNAPIGKPTFYLKFVRIHYHDRIFYASSEIHGT